jgi:hypothetical protein
MSRTLSVLALLLSLSSSAATISSSTCTSSVTTGCSVSYVASFTTLTYVVSGAWSGTIIFEGSTDGSSYVRLRACPLAGGECVTSVSSTGAWVVPTGGLPYARVRASAWTSGTATVTPQGSSTPIPADAVAVTTPDGGLPVTLGAQRVAVEATGPAGAPVTTTLDTQTLSALGPQPYTLRPGDWVLVGSSAAVPAPPDLPDGAPGIGGVRLRVEAVD